MSKHTHVAVLAAAGLLATVSLAPAQQGTGPMPGHGMMQGQGMTMQQPSDAASRAYMDGMMKMNRDMQMPMSGDADRDFAMMMIPHHQGAIDMARVQLQYGKDPELKKMAQKVIEDQEKEIADLRKWLAQQKR
jgi:uncharacterized protein (DUF305 family)